MQASRSASRKPGSGRTTPCVVEDRLDDHRRDRVALAGEQLADAVRVVVLADLDEVAHGGRDPGRGRGGRGHAAALVGREMMAPGDVVVPAVVVALELEDPLPARVAARQPDRVIRRLGPGAAEHDPLGRRDHPDQPLGQLDLERVGGRERHAVLVHGAHHGGVDARVVVPQQDRAERGVEVDELVAVDVPDARALGPGHEQRIRGRAATLALDAARRDGAGAGEQLRGLGRGDRPGGPGSGQDRRRGAIPIEGGHGSSIRAAQRSPGSATRVVVPLAAAA